MSTVWGQQSDDDLVRLALNTAPGRPDFGWAQVEMTRRLKDTIEAQTRSAARLGERMENLTLAASIVGCLGAFFAFAQVFVAALPRPIGAAVKGTKTLRGDPEAAAWLRRRLDGLTREGE